MCPDDRRGPVAPELPRRTPHNARAPLEPVRAFADDALSAIVREAPMSAEKLAFSWSAAVGPAIARATEVRLTGGGCLEVRTRSEAWRREIRRTDTVIRRKLAAWLGDGVVTSLRVSAPAVEAPARRRRGRRSA